MTLQHCSSHTLAQRVRAELGRVDNVIADPPFSERVSRGSSNGRRRDSSTGVSTRGLEYASWSSDDVRAFVADWAPLCARWFAVLCSHDQIHTYEREFANAKRYVFAPVPCVVTGSNVRLCGDGPSSWTSYLVASRPHAMTPRSGTLRGGYWGPRERLLVSGGKPLWLMRDIVRDYSRPGELVCDPCAGSGTTLLAARIERRAFVGCEADAGRFERARARLTRRTDKRAVHSEREHDAPADKDR